jgi:hypothetical protein
LRRTPGRWIQPDPAGLAAANPGNPQTWNRYAYVANNPAGAVDPLGLWRSDIFPYAYAKWGYSWITSLFLDSSGRVFNPFGLDPGFPTDGISDMYADQIIRRSFARAQPEQTACG